jgi:hypothetical protein
MLNAQFKPLDRWPGVQTKARRDASFRATYSQTLGLLESELSKLSAKQIVIQVEGLTLEYIRNDGWPRAGKNGHCGPGVIVSFESPKGSISMPCDQFRDWQDNIRAIAKSLEALRMVDRYGVTKGNEQYRGWTRLEAPKSGNMTREQGIVFLASLYRSPVEDMARLSVQDFKTICRIAKIENHPDHGGSHEIFVRIGQAEEALTA